MNSPDSPAPDANPGRPFQVNLQAVVELLSRNIYSHPSVYLRELIQNARDAVQARIDDGGLSPEDARITIIPTGAESPELVVRDNGIGMQSNDVASLLATVGQSSKRDIFDLPRTDRLGQFGIGLLSCFMIADSIVVETRSAVGGDPTRWVGKSDGTFTVEPLIGEAADAIPVGTTVRLSPRASDRELTTYARVWELAVEFAEFLPVTVEVLGPRGTDRYVNRTPDFGTGLTSTVGGTIVMRAHSAGAGPGDSQDDDADPTFAEARAYADQSDLEHLLDYGRELTGKQPLAAIALDVPQTQTRATAFVLPFQPSPSAKAGSRAYLGGLLVNASVPDLLPDWAFFVRVVLDSSGLTPTASREGFVNDEALALTTRVFAQKLRDWVMILADRDPVGLQQFLSVHDLALRSLAMHDQELATLVLPHLTFETSHGRMLLGDVVAKDPHVRFAASTEEFRQIAGVLPRDQLVVNAGYVYEADLMRMVPAAFAGASIDRVEINDVIADFAAVPPRDSQRAAGLARQAADSLWGLECEVEVRSFEPSDVPALYVVDPHVLRSMELRRLEETTDGFWGDLMREISQPTTAGQAGKGASEHAIGDASGAGAQAFATLVLNWNSPLIGTICSATDPLLVSRSIRLLYVQAILAGHNPLRPADRALLNESLADMLALSSSLMKRDLSANDFLDDPDSDVGGIFHE